MNLTKSVSKLSLYMHHKQGNNIKGTFAFMALPSNRRRRIVSTEGLEIPQISTAISVHRIASHWKFHTKFGRSFISIHNTTSAYMDFPQNFEGGIPISDRSQHAAYSPQHHIPSTLVG